MTSERSERSRRNAKLAKRRLMCAASSSPSAQFSLYTDGLRLTDSHPSLPSPELIDGAQHPNPHKPTREQLESQLYHILEHLDEASLKLNDTRPALLANDDDESTDARGLMSVEERDVTESWLAPPITYRIHQSSSRLLTDCPHLKNRFNTLVRKASQLCQMSTTEIYMVARAEDYFYVYNSVDVASHSPPVPQPHETIIRVAVAGSCSAGLV